MLPSERTLAAELNVNRSTVVAAYEELQALGIVERKKEAARELVRASGEFPENVFQTGEICRRRFILPNLPLVQRIRSEALRTDFVNLASGELALAYFQAKIFSKY